MYTLKAKYQTVLCNVFVTVQVQKHYKFKIISEICHCSTCFESLSECSVLVLIALKPAF